MWAMVLAGGRGVRLGHLTEEVPKPMIQIANVPLLERQVRWLIAGGVTDILFLLSYKPDIIQNYFRTGAEFGFVAHYCVQADLSYGTGGMVRYGLGILPPDITLFVVTNGDVLTDEPLQNVPRFADGHTVMAVERPSSYGVLRVQGKYIVEWHEHQVSWINAGVYLMRRDMGLDVRLPKSGPIEEFFGQASAQLEVYAYKSTRWWCSLDSFKDRLEMEEHFP